MRYVQSCCVHLFFFSRSSCEWLRKRVSTLNRSSRRNCLMGHRRQEQDNKLKNQSQVQTAALRLALAGMYMHVQQPFCIFIFKHCSPKMLPGRKRQSKRGSVGSLFPFAEIKCRVCIQAEQDSLRVCTFFSLWSWLWTCCLLAACRTSGDRSSQWRRPRWCPYDWLVADLAAAQGSLHQALALCPQKPQGLLSSGDNRTYF